MWVTRKQLNKMIEVGIENERAKFQSELTSKELEISHLKTDLAMKDLKHAVENLCNTVYRWSDHWELNENTESEVQ